jgi:hypothetical protein
VTSRVWLRVRAPKTRADEAPVWALQSFARHAAKPNRDRQGEQIMNQRGYFFAGAVVAAWALTAPFARDAHAQSLTQETMAHGPSEVFGDRGQIALSTESALQVSSASTSGVPGSTTTLTLGPTIDYFLVKSLSIGAFVLFDYTKAGDNHSTRFVVGPQVGYNFTLSDLISVWPKIGMSFASTDRTTAVSIDGRTNASTTNSNLALNVYVPMMFHPVQHFYAGFGPFLDVDLSGDIKTTVFGLRLTLGGWL